MATQLNTEKAIFGTLGTLIFSGANTTTFTTLQSNSKKGKILDIYNGTNAGIFVSFDGTTNHLYVPATTGKVIALGECNIHVEASVFVKLESAATSGTIYGALIAG